MTGNNKFWRASLAGLASVAMLATMGVTALTASAAPVSDAPNGKFDLTVVDKDGKKTTHDDQLTAGRALVDSLKVEDYTYAAPNGVVASDGSVFVGWADANGNLVDFTAPVTGDVTLTPKYVKADDTVEVTFGNADKYSFFPVAGTEANDSYTFHAPLNSALGAAQLPADAADGHLPKSWSAKVGNEGAKTVTDLKTVSWENPDNRTISVNVKDEVSDVVTLTFKGTADSQVPGATIDGNDDADYKVDVAKGTEVTLPALATKQAGDSYKAPSKWQDPSNKNKTLDFGAKYTADENTPFDSTAETGYYFVKFDSNGGSKVAGSYYTKGQYIKAPADPTKDKSVFAGWQKDSATSNVKYEFGAGYSQVNDAFITANSSTGSYVAPVVAYAKWDTDNSKTVKVTFKDANYEGAQKATEVKVNNAEYLTADQIPDWTRDGYVLTGWTADDGTAYTEAKLTEEIPVSKLNNGYDVVLTAVWTPATTDLAKIALNYVTTADKADFTAASWEKFEPVLKAAQKAYDTASQQTVGQISAAKSAEIVNQLNEGWKQLQFKATGDQGLLDGKLSSVHRLYSTSKDEHFYSATKAEIDELTSTQSTSGNWNDEGALFYGVSNGAQYVEFKTAIVRTYPGNTDYYTYAKVDKVEICTLTDKGQDLADALASFVIAKPVTRAYNLVSGDHVWSTSEAELKTLKADPSWSVEGTAFTIPVYNSLRDVVRLYNPAKNRHLLSTDPAEQALLAGKGWSVEGTAFKAF